MKKLKKVMVAVLSVCMLTSCGTVTDKQTGNNENNTVIEKENIAVDIDTMEEVVLDLDMYSLKNDSLKDAQSEILWNSAASSELGIYYWRQNSVESLGKEKLMFYDKTSQTSVVLCNRPNCTHSDDACNASFNAYSAEGIDFYRELVFYYEDSVFLVGNDEESFVNLYKVAADGSSWEKYMTLFKAEMTIVSEGDSTTVSWRHPTVCMHQNYVYYIDNSESTQKLRRIPIGGKETEVIFELEGEKTLVYRMLAYGDFVFFQSGKYVDEELVAGIYAYNTKTGEVSLVKKDALRGYFVVEDNLYYEKNEKIHKTNLKTGEDIELPISDITAEKLFFVNREGIYLFDENDGMLELFDDHGKLLASTQDDNINTCYFGTDGIFIGMDYSKGQVAFLELDALRSGNGKWIYGQ